MSPFDQFKFFYEVLEVFIDYCKLIFNSARDGDLSAAESMLRNVRKCIVK